MEINWGFMTRLDWGRVWLAVTEIGRGEGGTGGVEWRGTMSVNIAQTFYSGTKY